MKIVRHSKCELLPECVVEVVWISGHAQSTQKQKSQESNPRGIDISNCSR